MNKHSRFTSNGFKLAVLALAISGAGSAMAATATATSTSVVITPINITNNGDLSFGSIAGGATSGTVTVSPNGTRGYTGGTVAAGGTSSAAQFNVTGQAGLTYSINLAGTSASLSNGSGGSMAFTTITDTTASALTAGNGPTSTGTLTGGAQTVFVGGSLAVGANQVAGTYTGNISIAVDYN